MVQGAGGEDHRRVVLIWKLCLGDTIYEEQFSLEDRDEMNYPILLGRRTILKSRPHRCDKKLFCMGPAAVRAQPCRAIRIRSLTRTSASSRP
ncbi:MAG: ATP-dependent zinc protease [Nitrococcus mobilis]|nr:ATP-dependent zinc protease [Nitrococcus mobilis]